MTRRFVGRIWGCVGWTWYLRMLLSDRLWEDVYHLRAGHLTARKKRYMTTIKYIPYKLNSTSNQTILLFHRMATDSQLKEPLSLCYCPKLILLLHHFSLCPFVILPFFSQLSPVKPRPEPQSLSSINQSPSILAAHHYPCSPCQLIPDRPSDPTKNGPAHGRERNPDPKTCQRQPVDKLTGFGSSMPLVRHGR